MADISLTTVLLSAGISILTGFLGALLSQGWGRRQERRTYGMALLAEVTTIQRSLLRYEARLSRAVNNGGSQETATALRLWRNDLAVFANNTGRIGLFSSRTAVHLIEFYHQIRWLEARVAELDATADRGSDLPRWLGQQREALRRTRSRSRALRRQLQREIPLSVPDAGHRLRRVGRRWMLGPKRHFR